MTATRQSDECSKPNLGYGVGLRFCHLEELRTNPLDVQWLEILSENFMDVGGTPMDVLDELAERFPIVMHGVSMSIGTTSPINFEYLDKLKALAERCQPQWISDHICWTGLAHQNSHDLLPVPYTQEALDHLVERIEQIQNYLGRRLYFENPSTYLEFTQSHITEWDFLRQLCEEADCGLLLDLNNVYVSCFNHGWDAQSYLDGIPFERVAYFHLAGHTNKETHLLDTHSAPVIDEVWELYKRALAVGGHRTCMIEWDEDIPAFSRVVEELRKAKLIAQEAGFA